MMIETFDAAPDAVRSGEGARVEPPKEPPRCAAQLWRGRECLGQLHRHRGFRDGQKIRPDGELVVVKQRGGVTMEPSPIGSVEVRSYFVDPAPPDPEIPEFWTRRPDASTSR